MKEKLVILGGGISGIGAAKLGMSKNWDVFLSDGGKLSTKYKDSLKSMNVDFEENKHSMEKISRADVIVKSPGIPDNVPMIQELQAKGIKIVSEIEFAHQYTDAKIIAITGSNGKTTTASLTYHILKNAGYNVALGGNIGKSFAELVADGKHDYYVLELSSFQLDGIIDFKADVAVLLNITPDHLDRYDYSFEKYAKSKLQIINNQTEKDHFIYCYDDNKIKEQLKNHTVKAHHHPFSLNEEVKDGAYINNNEIVFNLHNSSFTMSIHKLALQGKHNLYNSMASGIASKLVDIRNENIRESLSDFENIEHRMEFVAKINERKFVNDSKATNVNSTWYALESMEGPVVWIAGGVDKGNDYEELMPLIKEKVKAIVCLGTDNKKLIETFSGVVENIVEANSAYKAVKASYDLSRGGDTIILSPACASFDLFDSYEDRGDQFKKAVKSL